MMVGCVVRQAGLADLEKLVPLFDGYRQFYGRSRDLSGARSFLHERLAGRDSVLFIAETDAQPAGFAQLFPSFSSAAMARVYILNDLFVQPDFRRQGIARRLITAATDYGAANCAARLTLSTATDNSPAQGLYSAMGWQRDQQFFVYHYHYNF